MGIKNLIYFLSSLWQEEVTTVVWQVPLRGTFWAVLVIAVKGRNSLILRCYF